MIVFNLDLLTDDRDKAIVMAKEIVMELLNLSWWPYNLLVDAVAEGDDDGFTEWQFTLYKD
jgi:hypothetical protein